MNKPNTWGVYLADNQKFGPHGVGTVHVNCLVNGSWNKCVLEGVLYVPFLKKNMFSIGQAIDKRFVTTYIKNTCLHIIMGRKMHFLTKRCFKIPMFKLVSH